MKKSKTNPETDWYFKKPRKWKEEINILRNIILSSGLTEELKWGCPCYTLVDKNIVLIHVFKEYCAVLFFKGALLKDQENILIQQTKNVQSGRQMRFISLAEVKELKPVLKAYVIEAITIEKAGLKVEFKKTAEYDMPEEFQIRLDEDAALKKAFYALTPGRQRGYLLYFSSAKQSKTREQRVEKHMKHIIDGKGMDDK
ncbi:MAG TPA: YdeI/OmpD-associated family protein [Ignavibacteria bacterium]|nr:YdeI/OmpD-associated family protein [Ignavibacteria bacterium]HMQ98783.1 YdeI/OmpD-associated family protein [Ignavibacteria bacterium]